MQGTSVSISILRCDATSSYLGRLPEGDWAPAAMLVMQQYSEDRGRAKLLLKEIDRLAHLLRVLCVGSGKRVRRMSEVVQIIRSRAPVRPGEGPLRAVAR